MKNNRPKVFGVSEVILIVTLTILASMHAIYFDAVDSDEIHRIETLSKDDPAVEQEWKEFIRQNPTPTVGEIKEIKRMIVAAATLAESKRNSAASQIASDSMRSLLDDYEESQAREEQSIALQRRLREIPFGDLTFVEKLLWIFIGPVGWIWILAAIVAILYAVLKAFAFKVEKTRA